MAYFPPGFHSTIDVMNTLPRDILTAVSNDVSLAVSQRSALPLGSLYTSGSKCSELQMNSVINAIQHIFRSKNDLESLSNTTSISVETVQVLKSAKPISSAIASNVGKILDLNWKLGLGIASNDCDSRQEAFVTIQLTLENGGVRSVKTFELSASEFQDFFNTFHTIATRLDSA